MDPIVSLQDLNWEKFEAWSQGSQYGGAELPLASLLGAKHLGFHLETLNSGKFSCPYHLHRAEEELFIALKGSCVVRMDGNFRRFSQGELIFFRVGVCHQFYNPGPEPFFFFALSNKDETDVCEYPDSRKIIQRSPRKITQDGREIDDYWVGEEDPRAFWPAEWLK